jgi:shikimate kinase
MKGCAKAPGAGTILNALANGYGSSFAIDIYTKAKVELYKTGDIEGKIKNIPEGDTRLIERCVELVIDQFGDNEGGSIITESEIPIASGLKSSSAAANAAVLASLSALSIEVGEDGEIGKIDACLIGVQAARDVGVTVTGAFDDASASMMGGLTITNNSSDELLKHDTEIDWEVLVWVPEMKAYSSDANIERCSRIKGVADIIVEMAKDGRYAEAMTINGLSFCAALEYSADPILEAMQVTNGVSLSGTGPSVVAIGKKEGLIRLEKLWNKRGGKVFFTRTQNDGACTI